MATRPAALQAHIRGLKEAKAAFQRLPEVVRERIATSQLLVFKEFWGNAKSFSNDRPIAQFPHAPGERLCVICRQVMSGSDEIKRGRPQRTHQGRCKRVIDGKHRLARRLDSDGGRVRDARQLGTREELRGAGPSHPSGARRSMNQFSDSMITCLDCRVPFTFTAGEQEFFATHGVTPPKRCKTCREWRKQDRRQSRVIRRAEEQA